MEYIFVIFFVILFSLQVTSSYAGQNKLLKNVNLYFFLTLLYLAVLFYFILL